MPQSITSPEMRMIFSDNLRQLVTQTRKPVTTLAQDTGVNRTQLNRYLNGEAYPRPDVLHRICTYFGTDARILTTPIAEISSALPTNQIELPEYFPTTPVDTKTLPDGIYTEWKYSMRFPGMISQLPARIWTENGQRRMRIKAPDPSLTTAEGRNYTLPQNRFSFHLFAQRNGFAAIDGTPTFDAVAFTSFRVGYSVHDDIYPGYKLTGISYVKDRLHTHGPCLLQRVKQDRDTIFKIVRSPRYTKIEDAPPLISMVLAELVEEALPLGWGT